MKNGIYCLYNKLSLRYGTMFMLATDAVASKAVAEMEKNKAIDIEEVELCKIGEFNIETGEITPQAPVRLEIVNKKIPIEKAKSEAPTTI